MIKITKNDRKGYVLDSKGDLHLTKDLHWLDNHSLHHSDFVGWHYYLGCGKQKLRVLITVIKWLYD
jgi:hypothetical protein